MVEMTDTHWWPDDYFSSRSRFQELARRAGARVESHPVKAVGPRGEPLSIDTAVLASAATERLIVISSGVHGVEGYIGACIQINALQNDVNANLSKTTGLALIHAVNPWGYAHLRRVNEDNIDVNRNFFDPARPHPEAHPNYARLDSLINPRGAPSFVAKMQYPLDVITQIIRHRGIRPLSEIIATGQYHQRQGLFFGGNRISESSQLLQNILNNLSADVKQIVHLDLHSGLGRAATATLIANSNCGTPDQCLNWIRQHYRQPAHVENESGIAYQPHGTLGQWYRRALNHKQFLYICVEIGTVNPLKVFSALRLENQAHHWTTPGSDPYVKTKRILLNVFAPRSSHWRQTSLNQGMAVINRTLTQSENSGKNILGM